METENKEPFKSLFEGKRVYSVSEINRRSKTLLESQLGIVWIEGEISNFIHHSSGHMYFSLKDKNAQISAAFFSQNQKGLKFQLKNGLKILAFARISIYEVSGKYQLYITRVEPQGVGALELALRQLKEKLMSEGLFDDARKKPIPKFPKTVGVITSPTGAALQDILNIVQRRFCSTHLLIYPVRVQGEGSAEEIAEAIAAMNEQAEADVLIVGRGGGSLEDLWAFNEEVVARAVYASKIPIISAVGHEIDFSICDMVSDLRAPTPSAAAELVTANAAELVEQLRDKKSRLVFAVKRFLNNIKEQIETFQKSAALKLPQSLWERETERLDELTRDIQKRFQEGILKKKQNFEKVLGFLNALNPLNILERGYAVAVRNSGEVIKSVKAVEVGETLTLRLQDGKLISKIIKKEEGEIWRAKKKQ